MARDKTTPEERERMAEEVRREGFKIQPSQDPKVHSDRRDRASKGAREDREREREQEQDGGKGRRR